MIISNSGRGALFTIDSSVTLILDNGITLRGRNNNDAPVITVNGRGELIMNSGSKITGNTNTRANWGGGGVFVHENAIFRMNGGEIFNNNVTNEGGGGVDSGGEFILSGGRIYNNRAKNGGGVVIWGGSFTMTGGEISNNSAIRGESWHGRGGAVYMQEKTIINLLGGVIFGNTAIDSGGGLYLEKNTTFSMQDGEISGNTANIGGGVYSEGVLIKTGGIIYGSSGTHNDNRASTRGHAVLVNNRIRNNTAGNLLPLDSRQPGSAGGWEN
jgi:hypothetical protein